jgi:hypothetical protein
MYCVNCGKELPDNANFCGMCGAKVNKTTNYSEDKTIHKTTNYVEDKIIHKARVTFVCLGYGDITLTTRALIWNKSATSYIAFGALNSLTNDHVLIPFENIAKVGTYTYLPGGGIVLLLKDGKEQKIAFKWKKDFNIVYEYLRKNIMM